jgi:predicted RNA-binding Zn-ribbon protein involved in translation (DUF1610 family)
MFKSHEVNYKCPYCGKEFAITVYDAVNVKDDIDMRDRCVMGEVFRQTCPNCGRQFMVQNQLTYIDPDHKFVLFVSQQPVEGFDLKKMTEPLVKQGYTLRRCSTVAEFTEKIQVLEDGVDDVLVELAKYDSYIEFVENKKGEADEVTAVEYQKCENGVMKVNVKTEDKGMAFIIPVSMLEEERDQHKDLYHVDNETFPCVNGQWMASLFEEPEGQA